MPTHNLKLYLYFAILIILGQYKAVKKARLDIDEIERVNRLSALRVFDESPNGKAFNHAFSMLAGAYSATTISLSKDTDGNNARSLSEECFIPLGYNTTI